MAWDGSGGFTRTNGTQTGSTTWANARDAGNNITASQHDTHDQDLADGIAACLTKNGETKPTADFKPNADASYHLGSAALRWINLYLSGFVGDANGNELLKFSATASAVNEVTITNAATGTSPKLSATGGDTNLGLEASPKGTGKFTVTDGTDTTKKALLDVSGVATGTSRTITMPDANVDLQYARAASETIAGGVELATTAEAQTGTDTSRAITPATLHAAAIVTGTVTAAAGQTSVDYTIPSWAKEITVIFNEWSTNSTSRKLIQLGDGAPGIETTGYVSTSNEVNQASGTAGASSTAGFVIDSTLAADIISGHYTFTLVDAATFTWIGSGVVKKATTHVVMSAGSKALSAALTTIRITTVNGTDTADGGSVNVFAK